MSILNFARTYRNIVRTKEIISILTKHGFGHIVARLNLRHYFPKWPYRHFKTVEPPLCPDSIPVRMRLAFEELGPTFIKLGQILSARPDMLPDAYINEFKQLQDQVPPFPCWQAREIIAQELRAPVDEVFEYFEETALASGSIGQAHQARLPDGTEVIIKVRRPGIEQTIFTDISILLFLAELAEKYIEELRLVHPVMIIEEFSRSIRRELDFIIEASYTAKFHQMLKETPQVVCPQVFWHYSTTHILTIEKLQGVNISQIDSLPGDKIDRKVLAANLASVFMKQYFVTGLFHADPHPGNILVSPNGELGLIDFGLVGHLSHELKSQLATLILALVRNDTEMIVEIFSDIGVFPNDINLREIKSDILELMDKYFGTPLQHMDMAKVFQDVIYVARMHRTLLPRDFILLGKSLVTVTSIARDLDPDFNLAQAISPHVSALLQEKFSPQRLLSIASVQVWNLMTLLQRFPSAAKVMLRKLRSGNFQITLRHEDFGEFITQIDRAATRLALALMFAAIFIGASLLMIAQVGPLFHGMPLTALIAYALSLVLGVRLLFSGHRSSRS